MIFNDPLALSSSLAGLRLAGHTIALCPGCFDMLHAGHVRLFQEARKRADFVIAATNTDASIQRTKGSTRPIVPLVDRVAMLEACRYVDAVIWYETDTPADLCKVIRPDLMVKGDQYSGESLPGSEFCGGVYLVPMLAARSTSLLVAEASARSVVSVR